MQILKTPKLSVLIFFSITVIVFLSLATLGTLWAISEYSSFSKESKVIKDKYIESKKLFLKEEVDEVLSGIKNKRATSESITRIQIKQRVDEANSMANRLNSYYSDQMSKEEIREIFKETLRDIRFFNGRGYYFAFDLNAIERLLPINPDLEGRDMSRFQDSNGQAVVMDMLKIAKSKGEGYYEYTWPMPGGDNQDHIKIAYITLIPEFDWVIGVGDYPDAIEIDMKKEILETLSEIEIKDAGYIFGGTFDGVSMLGPAVGQNMLNVTDVNGKKIVVELINAAKKGGGYVEYVMPKFENTKPLPKISYTAPVSDWNWYLGFGVYINEIDDEINAAYTELQKDISFKMLNITVVFLASLLISLFFTSRLSSQFKKSYNTFYSFFQTSVFENEILDLNKFGLQEFREIAKLVNSMVKRKKAVDEELHRTIEERSALLSEIHHRVKNNFQAVASLLSLQKRTTENQEVHEFLDQARDRMYTMAEVHEMLYQAEDFSQISIQDYLEHIMQNLHQSLDIDSSNIKVNFDVKDITFNIERAVPIGLILNELVTNSCKHAFTGEIPEEINVLLEKVENSIILKYWDNGKGITGISDINSLPGFGFQIVDILSKQIGGEMHVSSDRGFHFELKFPDIE